MIDEKEKIFYTASCQYTNDYRFKRICTTNEINYADISDLTIACEQLNQHLSSYFQHLSETFPIACLILTVYSIEI